MRIIAVVGMTGSGKSTVSDLMVEKGFQFLRLGQITLDIVKERELEPTEENERPIREEIRKKHGKDAYAVLNFTKIDGLSKKGDVVLDNLYSWEELLAYRERYGNDFMVLAVVASPKTRYRRLSNRVYDKSADKKMRFRPLNPKQAMDRDMFDIKKFNISVPIAMADHYIVNEGTVDELKILVNEFLGSLS